MDLPPSRGFLHDLTFFHGIRVRYAHAEHEPIELCFGQHVGSLRLNRILRGDHHEGRFEAIRVSADGDLLFLHGLEQGSLCLWRRTIDLVGEQEIRKDRTWEKPHSALSGAHVFLNDIGANNV